MRVLVSDCKISDAARQHHSAMARNVTAAVAELLQNVKHHYRPLCSKMLHGGTFSFAQAHQDWYIFHNVFSARLEWGKGAYVDIGTNDPLLISNTLFFDKCLGWRGALQV